MPHWPAPHAADGGSMWRLRVDAGACVDWDAEETIRAVNKAFVLWARQPGYNEAGRDACEWPAIGAWRAWLAVLLDASGDAGERT